MNYKKKSNGRDSSTKLTRAVVTIDDTVCIIIGKHPPAPFKGGVESVTK